MSKKQIAIAIQKRMAKAYPTGSQLGQYGRAYMKRGDPTVTSMYGTSWRAATEQQKMNRKATGFTGRGKYGVRKFMRDAAYVSSGAKNIYDTWRGSGLYSGRGVYSGSQPGGGTSNGLISGGRRSMQFASANDETQSLVFSHCEYLQDVYAPNTSAFNVESWSLNPGLVENFPFCSQLAANFEEYEFIQLIFHYKSTVDPSAANNSTGATGTIIMATNYNPSAPSFSNKEVMMQYHGANSGRVTDDHTHGVECDPAKNAGTATKYVRSSPVVVDQDLKTYDLGKFQLATVNLPSAYFNQQIGELWIEYKVKLSKPRLFTSLYGNVAEWRLTSGGGETAMLPFSNPLIMQQSTIPMRMTQVSGSISLFFPDWFTGLVEIQLLIEGTTLVYGGFPTTWTGNVSPWNDLYAVNNVPSDAPGNNCAAASANQIIYISRWMVHPTTGNVDQTITFGFPSNSGNVTQGSIIVRACNPMFAQTNGQPTPLYINSAGTVTSPG